MRSLEGAPLPFSSTTFERERERWEGRWEGKAGRKFSRYTVYIEQATTFDEARRPTSARILAIFAVHRPVPRQRVARFTFRTYLATKPSHRFLRFNVSISLKFLSKDALRFYYNISFFYRGYSIHKISRFD